MLNKTWPAILAAVLLSGASAGAQPRDADPLPLTRIRAVVESHRPAINRCYTTAHRERPGTPHHIEMTFRIQPNGRVTNVTFPLTAWNQSLGFCIGRLMQAWQFPRPSDGSTMTVEYPFDF